ncbi:MAG: IS110 family transposase [Deltaproteobacteria bacterium]|nr:IS110 family transposase [Deltaproteobacteria bacterium]
MKTIRTKKMKFVNEKTLIVAVDIGKVSNQGYGRCPNGEEVKPFEFFNNGEGFKKFWGRIWQVKETYHLEAVVVGFESTGPYGEPLVHFLSKRPVRLVQVNPMHTKRLKELEGNSPEKTDRKDPKVIADIMGLGHALTVIIPEGAAAELRRLTQARERAVQRKTALWNQLQSLIALLFPEFLQVMKDLKTHSARYRVSRGKLKLERARAVYEAASESVGIQEGERSLCLEIRELLGAIAATEGFVAVVEQEMAQGLGQIPYSPFLLSVRGVGKVTVAGLIGEVGDFRKFHTLAEIMKLAGLNLFEISSGQHKGRRHISKRGRPLLRKLLFFAALNMVRQNGLMRPFYQRLVGRGMRRIKALVAVARKLLGILFALVRDQRFYIPDYGKKGAVELEAA